MESLTIILRLQHIFNRSLWPLFWPLYFHSFSISPKSQSYMCFFASLFYKFTRRTHPYLFCIQVITLRYTSGTFGVYCLFVICKSRLSLSVYNHYLYFDSGWSPVPFCDKIKGQKVSFLLFPLKIFIYKQYIVYPPLPVGRKASIARRNYAYLLWYWIKSVCPFI